MEKRGGELKTKPNQKPKTLTLSSTSLNEGVLFIYSFILKNILLCLVIYRAIEKRIETE